MKDLNISKIDNCDEDSPNETLKEIILNMGENKTKSFDETLKVLSIKMENISKNKNVIGSNFLSKIPKNNLNIQLIFSKFSNKTKKVIEPNIFKIEKHNKSTIVTQGDRETKSSINEENYPNQKNYQQNYIILGNSFEQKRQNQDIHQLINFGDINSNQNSTKMFIGKKRGEEKSKELLLMNCFNYIESLYKKKNDEKFKILTENVGFFSKINTIIENGKNVCVVYTEKKITNIFLVKERRFTNNEEEIQTILETLKKNIEM